MLLHIPICYKLLTTFRTLERLDTRVLSQVRFKVRPAGVFSVTILLRAIEFVFIVVRFIMVHHNLHRLKFFFAAFKGTLHLGKVTLQVSGLVIF